MKVVIIGCGNVGMSYAYSLVNQRNRVNELVLIDVNKDKAVGEALDLNHALPFSHSNMHIYAGSYSDCRNADLIVISAGASQLKGETRLDLIDKNHKIFESIIGQIKKTNFDGIYLIATNPVDIMSYITYKLTGDHKKVIGSGTTLDTARLKYLLGKVLSVNPKNVHAYVLGEHGDSEMVLWSQATIGVKDIKEYLSVEEMSHIKENVRNSAYDIIEKKGSTCYGIGVCLATITNSIGAEDSSILTLSVYNKEHDIYISSPAIVTKAGVRDVVDVSFNKEEQEEYNNSVKVLKDVAKKLKL